MIIGRQPCEQGRGDKGVAGKGQVIEYQGFVADKLPGNIETADFCAAGFIPVRPGLDQIGFLGSSYARIFATTLDAIVPSFMKALNRSSGDIVSQIWRDVLR